LPAPRAELRAEQQNRSGSGARYTRVAFLTAGLGMMGGGIALSILGFMGCFGKGRFSDHGRDLCSNMVAYDPYAVTQPKPRAGETEPTGLQIGTMTAGPIMTVLGVILACAGCFGCCAGDRNPARHRDIEMPPVDSRLG
jgi:hypothetical protein